MSKIAQSIRSAQRLRKSGVVAKLWPNGEITFSLPKKAKQQPLSKETQFTQSSVTRSFLAQRGISQEWLEVFLMGLSNVRNFDSVETGRPQYGLKGMTSLGKRRVRNACHMMAKEGGKYRLTFATVTLPAFECEDYVAVHDHWDEIIDDYRRQMSRKLKRWGLSGEIVGVSEVQEKRYEETGYPVLHGHFLFVGMGSSGGWAISPNDHDRIWANCLRRALHGPVPSLSSAAKLESLRGDVDAYMGKYMSKGTGIINQMVADNFGWAIPKQWWNCSRSLVRRMENQMRRFRDGCGWLIARAADGDDGIWDYYSVFELEMPDGDRVAMGAYGKLTKRANRQVREFLGLNDRIYASGLYCPL